MREAPYTGAGFPARLLPALPRLSEILPAVGAGPLSQPPARQRPPRGLRHVERDGRCPWLGDRAVELEARGGASPAPRLDRVGGGTRADAADGGARRATTQRLRRPLSFGICRRARSARCAGGAIVVLGRGAGGAAIASADGPERSSDDAGARPPRRLRRAGASARRSAARDPCRRRSQAACRRPPPSPSTWKSPSPPAPPGARLPVRDLLRVVSRSRRAQPIAAGAIARDCATAARPMRCGVSRDAHPRTPGDSARPVAAARRTARRSAPARVSRAGRDLAGDFGLAASLA